MPGIFISFEGLDGSGKTSVIDRVAGHYSRRGVDVCATSEPYLHEVSDLVKHSHVELCADAELLLFAADRAQHIERVIKPALNAGQLVLCDRFILSTYAYQIYGRQNSPELFYSMSANLLTMPTMHIILEISPELSVQRRQGHEPDTFERRELEYFRRVADGYQAAPYNMKCSPVLYIDASKPLDYVVSQCTKHIDRVRSGG